MARAVGIDFKITGDSAKAVAAWREVATAAQKAGNQVGAVGKQIETALNKAEAAQRKSVSSAAFGAGQKGATGKLENLANTLGLGQFADELGGIEDALGGMSTKAAVATVGVVGLGAATAKFAKISADAYLNTVDQVDAVGDALGGSAAEADKVVGIFRGLGISADQGAGALAKLAKNVTTNSTELRKYGVVIARTADGGVDMYETLLNVAAAYQAQDDPAAKAQVAAAAFGKEWQSMVDILETSTAKLDKFGGKLAPGITDEDIESVKAYKATVGEFKGQYNDLKTTVGRPIVFFAGAQLDKLNTSLKGAGALLSGDFSGAWDIARGKTNDAGVSFVAMSTAVARLGIAAAVASPQIREIAVASEVAAAASAKFAALTDTATTRAGARIRLATAISSLSQTQDQAAASASRYADAQAAVGKAASDGAKAIADAEADGAKAIADAQESGAKAVADAQESQAKTTESNTQRIADVEKRTAETIVKAQEKVAEARKRASDQAQDDADRVIDAQRALVDAKASAAGEDNRFQAGRKVDDAQLALDRALRDRAQNQQDDAADVAKAEKESVADIKDAQTDLADTRREAADSAAEAAQRLADAQQEAAARVADAQEQASKRIADAQDQAAERVASAQQSAASAADTTTVSIGNQAAKMDDLVSATFDAAFQTREMGGSQDDIKKKVDDSKTALDQYGISLGLTIDQIKYYKALLDLIPLQVRTKIKYSFENVTDRLAGAAANAVAAAAALALAENLPIPQFAGGGMFRASGGGAGLAVLHDGEKVLTPEQQQQGGGITIINYGVIGGEQELQRMLARGQRRGFRVIS